MEAAVEKRWSVTVSDLQAWTYTIQDCQMTLCARNTSFFFFFFPRTTVFLAGPHAVCPFGMADWLNRLRAFIIYTVFLINKKKCKKNKNIASRGSNTEPGIAKPVALFHHSHRIVDSSRQSSPGISPKDCFKCGKFWGIHNFSYKLISECPSGHLTSGG